MCVGIKEHMGPMMIQRAGALRAPRLAGGAGGEAGQGREGWAKKLACFVTGVSRAVGRMCWISTSTLPSYKGGTSNGPKGFQTNKGSKGGGGAKNKERQ